MLRSHLPKCWPEMRASRVTDRHQASARRGLEALGIKPMLRKHAAALSPGLRKFVESFSEVVEPAHALVEGTAREMPLRWGHRKRVYQQPTACVLSAARILAAADQMAYECGTERIHFSPTVLFQTRLHRFKVLLPQDGDFALFLCTCLQVF